MSIFKKITSIFTANNQQTPTDEEAKTAPSERPIQEYLSLNIKSSPHIKTGQEQATLQHLLGIDDLNKKGAPLSIEEKKALGYNAKLAITHELLKILSDEGRALKNPKAALDELYHKSSSEKSRDDLFYKALNAGITSFKLCTSGDGSECEWCRERANETFGPEIMEQFKSNCSCNPYSKCFFTPEKLSWDD